MGRYHFPQFLTVPELRGEVRQARATVENLPDLLQMFSPIHYFGLCYRYLENFNFQALWLVKQISGTSAEMANYSF